MKKYIYGLLVVFFIVGFAAKSDSFAQVSIEEMGEAWDKMAKYTIDIAELMPEEHYDFKPVDVLRSFKEQLYHQSDSYWAGGFVKVDMKERTHAATKAGVIKDLKEMFAEYKNGLLGLDKSDLDDKVMFFNQGEFSRMRVLLKVADHLTHTRGITIMYLRLKGIAPPPEGNGW